MALRVSGGVPDSLRRICDAEAGAERSYRSEVQGRRAAEATGILRLSATVQAAIGAMGVAKDEAARLAAWKAAQSDTGIGDELKAFRAAVDQRLGADTVRARFRSEGRAGGGATAGRVTRAGRSIACRRSSPDYAKASGLGRGRTRRSAEPSGTTCGKDRDYGCDPPLPAVVHGPADPARVGALLEDYSSAWGAAAGLLLPHRRRPAGGRPRGVYSTGCRGRRA